MDVKYDVNINGYTVTTYLKKASDILLAKQIEQNKEIIVQNKKIIEKLEEVRCGIIDVENAVDGLSLR